MKNNMTTSAQDTSRQPRCALTVMVALLAVLGLLTTTPSPARAEPEEIEAVAIIGAVTGLVTVVATTIVLLAGRDPSPLNRRAEAPVAPERLQAPGLEPAVSPRLALEPSRQVREVVVSQDNLAAARALVSREP